MKLDDTKKTELLNALNEYYLGEDFYEYSMKDLDRCIAEGNVGLANTSEKDYHEVQVSYFFNEEEIRYFVDDFLIEIEPMPIDEFIENVADFDFCELISPCTGFVNGLYEPLEDRAHELIDAPYIEIYPGWDCLPRKNYFVVAFSYEPRWRKTFCVDSIEELATATPESEE